MWSALSTPSPSSWMSRGYHDAYCAIETSEGFRNSKGTCDPSSMLQSPCGYQSTNGMLLNYFTVDYDVLMALAILLGVQKKRLTVAK